MSDRCGVLLRDPQRHSIPHRAPGACCDGLGSHLALSIYVFLPCSLNCQPREDREQHIHLAHLEQCLAQRSCFRNKGLWSGGLEPIHFSCLVSFVRRAWRIWKQTSWSAGLGGSKDDTPNLRGSGGWWGEKIEVTTEDICKGYDTRC